MFTALPSYKTRMLIRLAKVQDWLKWYTEVSVIIQLIESILVQRIYNQECKLLYSWFLIVQFSLSITSIVRSCSKICCDCFGFNYIVYTLKCLLVMVTYIDSDELVTSALKIPYMNKCSEDDIDLHITVLASFFWMDMVAVILFLNWVGLFLYVKTIH